MRHMPGAVVTESSALIVMGAHTQGAYAGKAQPAQCQPADPQLQQALGSISGRRPELQQLLLLPNGMSWQGATTAHASVQQGNQCC
jgi:hypothetical protein